MNRCSFSIMWVTYSNLRCHALFGGIQHTFILSSLRSLLWREFEKLQTILHKTQLSDRPCEVELCDFGLHSPCQHSFVTVVLRHCCCTWMHLLPSLSVHRGRLCLAFKLCRRHRQSEITQGEVNLPSGLKAPAPAGWDFCLKSPPVGPHNRCLVWGKRGPDVPSLPALWQQFHSLQSNTSRGPAVFVVWLLKQLLWAHCVALAGGHIGKQACYFISWLETWAWLSSLIAPNKLKGGHCWYGYCCDTLTSKLKLRFFTEIPPTTTTTRPHQCAPWLLKRTQKLAVGG